MRTFITSFKLLPIISVVCAINVMAQDVQLPEGFPAFTIPVNNSPDEGYLFMTTRATSVKQPASLVISDNYGTPVFYQHLPGASGGFTLQRNGLLSYRTNSSGSDRFYVMDSSFMIIDSVWMDDYELDGHDFMALENGHYIIFGTDKRTTDLSAYGGKPDATVEGCVIREVDAAKNIVFEWNSWDYFKITDTYKDLTVSAIDLVHPNSLELDGDGHILLISRGMNEVTKIHRQTGELLWRLGGKNNQFTFSDSAHMFSMPHDFRLLENGHYTIFDNGNDRNPRYSRAIEYVLDEVNMTAELVWEYDANRAVYGPSGGSTRRLPSGTTIVGYGGKASQPAAIEVHPDGSSALRVDFTGDMSSGRTLKFPWRTNLFEPNTWEIDFGEWDGYTTADYLLTITNNADYNLTLTGYSTRTDAFTINDIFPIEIPAGGNEVFTVSYFPVTINQALITDVLTIDSDIESDTLIRRVSQQIALIGKKQDFDAPEVTILEDGTVGLPLDTVIHIFFTEPVRMVNDDEFNYKNVDQLFTFKKDGADGMDVAFDAVINTEKNRIVLIPDEALTHTHTYFVSVSGQYEDYAGNPGSSVTGTFTTGSSTVVDTWETFQFDLYPNPGRGLYQIRFGDQDQYLIELFDMNGRLRYNSSEIQHGYYSLDITAMADGPYMLRITQRSSNKVRSILIFKE